ncbi:hypothetical protein EDB19DRAFT_1827738 [Suillus lakei]|nr:hypothetical protein EDB19DRAFT_1827738 [Suillus lakei]
MPTSSCDMEGKSDSFSLTELQLVVETLIIDKLQLGLYLAQIVLDVLIVPLLMLWSLPAFTKNKLATNNYAFFEKVATCEVTAAFTMVPVSRIYSRDSDASNNVGEEYMKQPFPLRLDAVDPESSYEGRPDEVRSVFMKVSDRYPEWTKLYDMGRRFRGFSKPAVLPGKCLGFQQS